MKKYFCNSNIEPLFKNFSNKKTILIVSTVFLLVTCEGNLRAVFLLD